MCKIETAKELERRGDIVGALQIYRRLYDQNPNHEAAIEGLAQCAMWLDKPEIAFEFYLKLLIVNHQNPRGYLGRAHVMFLYGQTEKALHDIAIAVELDEPATAMRIDCAALLNDYGYAEMARRVLKPILKTYRCDDDFVCEWGYACLATNHIDSHVVAMIDAFEKRWPDDPFVALCHAMMALKVGDESAKIQLHELLEIAPELEGKIASFLNTSTR